MSTIEPPRPDGSSGYHRPTMPSGMPQFPHAPAPPESPLAAPVAQPRPIRIAVQLMWAGAVISLLSLIATFTTLDSLKSQLRERLEENGQQMSDNVLDTGFRFAVTFAVIAGIVAIGLWMWMAWKNGQGRQWARIVATVLGVINVIATIFGITSGNSTTAASIISVVNVILAIVILVLLWRKESSDFYTARSRRSRLPY